MNKVSKLSHFLIYMLLTFLLVVIMFPVLYTIISSFKTNAEIMAHPEHFFPREFTLNNYISAWTSESFNVGRMLWNSIYYTLFCVLFSMISASIGAYVFERGNFRGKNALFVIITSTMFINLGTMTVYPMFQILNNIHLSKSLFGLIFIKAFTIPITSLFLVKGYISTLPKSMDEAAIIDGCGFIGVFVRILFPLLKPILATVFILSFQNSWNEYMMPSIFTMASPKQRTLMVGVVALKSTSTATASWNLMLAGSTIALIPVLVIYAIANKQIIAGLSEGSLKG